MILVVAVASGNSFRPGEEEDEEEGGSILDADESDRCHSEASAACWAQHLCPRGTRAYHSG